MPPCYGSVWRRSSTSLFISVIYLPSTGKSFSRYCSCCALQSGRMTEHARDFPTFWDFLVLSVTFQALAISFPVAAFLLASTKETPRVCGLRWPTTRVGFVNEIEALEVNAASIYDSNILARECIHNYILIVPYYRRNANEIITMKKAKTNRRPLKSTQCSQTNVRYLQNKLTGSKTRSKHTQNFLPVRDV